MPPYLPLLKKHSLDNVSSVYQLAKLLGFSPDGFLKLLYAHKNSQYYQFEIPKKNGGSRLITAPLKNSNLKRLQTSLNLCLQEYIQNKNIPLLDHAFIQQRSILTNAKIHTSKRYVFNIDLKNFFHQINFGRVRGFFIKNSHFALNSNIATVLAEIVTYNNFLPQGAPSSPIISNLIGSTMDFYLLELAKRNKCHYSRYADDITFSTNLKHFPKDIAYSNKTNQHNWHPGKELIKIINKAGFKINNKKIVMSYSCSSQNVTGLTVNKKANIPKSYYKKTRAMVDCLTKWNHYYINDRLDKTTPETKKYDHSQLSRLQGRLNYIYFIKTQIDAELSLNSNNIVGNIAISDKAYVKLYRKFIFYKYIIANSKPLIITEGKTDILHIKTAIKKIDNYPNLFSNGQLKLQFLKHDSQHSKILKIGDHKDTSGTAKIRNFLDNCYIYFKIFKKPLLNHPVIILLDNDKGILTLNGNKKGKRNYLNEIKNKNYSKIYKNLYVLPLRPFISSDDSSSKPTDIESLYPIEIETQFKTSKQSKIVFAKTVIPNLPLKDFIGFDSVLSKISEIISNYSIEKEGRIFYCSGAKGYLSDNNKFILLANSTISHQNSNLRNSYLSLKNQLINNKIIINNPDDSCFLTKNYLFSSPSAAASIVLGHNVNGWLQWKNKQGSLLADFK